MTTLSTHDTKRSEDVRARLGCCRSARDEWADDGHAAGSAAAERHRSPAGPDAATEQLVWQTLVGAWPLAPTAPSPTSRRPPARPRPQTSWTDPAGVRRGGASAFVRGVLGGRRSSPRRSRRSSRGCARPGADALAQKLVQLTMPGVADIYQGTELLDLSLVDPDNRRPVDYAPAARRCRVDGAPRWRRSAPRSCSCRAALRLRRDAPRAVPARSRPTSLPTPATARSAFVRGGEARHRRADALAAGRAGTAGATTPSTCPRDVARPADRCDAQRARTARATCSTTSRSPCWCAHDRASGRRAGARRGRGWTARGPR